MTWQSQQSWWWTTTLSTDDWLSQRFVSRNMGNLNIQGPQRVFAVFIASKLSICLTRIFAALREFLLAFWKSPPFSAVKIPKFPHPSFGFRGLQLGPSLISHLHRGGQGERELVEQFFGLLNFSSLEIWQLPVLVWADDYAGVGKSRKKEEAAAAAGWCLKPIERLISCNLHKNCQSW